MKSWKLFENEESNGEVTPHVNDQPPATTRPTPKVTKMKLGSQWKIPGSTFLKALGANDLSHSVDQYNASAHDAGQFYKIEHPKSNQQSDNTQPQPEHSSNDEHELTFPEIHFPDGNTDVRSESINSQLKYGNNEQFIKTFEQICENELRIVSINESSESTLVTKRGQGGIPW